MLRHEITGGEAEVVELTDGQYQLLNLLRGVRRAAIVGGRRDRQDDARGREGATSGAARASRPCSSASTRRWRGCSPTRPRTSPRTTGRLTVATFHQLCQDLGREAGVLRGATGARSAGVVGRDPARRARRGWRAARPAVPRDRRRRGPGLRRRTGSCRSRPCSFGGREDVLYVFHDPAQAIYREDVVGAARAAGVPARAELPERPADPRRRAAVRGRWPRGGRRCGTTVGRPS